MARLDALISNLKGPAVDSVSSSASENVQAPSNGAASTATAAAAAAQVPWYWPMKPPPGLREASQKQAWALKQQEDFVVELFLHAADIGSPAMPFTQFQKWNRLVTEEFLLQGDLEVVEFGQLISPPAGFGRYHQSDHSRHGFTTFFIQFLSLPLFEKLDELTRIGVTSAKNPSTPPPTPFSSFDNFGKPVEPGSPHLAIDKPRTIATGILGEGNLVAGVSIGPCLSNLRANLSEWIRLMPPKPEPSSPLLTAASPPALSASAPSASSTSPASTTVAASGAAVAARDSGTWRAPPALPPLVID